MQFNKCPPIRFLFLIRRIPESMFLGGISDILQITVNQAGFSYEMQNYIALLDLVKAPNRVPQKRRNSFVGLNCSTVNRRVKFEMWIK